MAELGELTMRPATLGDLNAIAEIYNEAILTTTATFDTEPKTVEEIGLWFQKHGENHPVIVADLAGIVVGWACISKWSERPAYIGTGEISVYVSSKHRGTGIGRQLIGAIIGEANRLEFRTLIARVSEGSDVSIHLHESFGFEHVGVLKQVGHKFGKLLDVYVMQKMLK